MGSYEKARKNVEGKARENMVKKLREDRFIGNTENGRKENLREEGGGKDQGNKGKSQRRGKRENRR